MGRAVNQPLKIKKSSGFRRSMLAFLALVYLFVGTAHNISCLDQAVASSFSIESPSDDPNQNGAKPGMVLCDHCPTCAPAVMPTFAVADVPSALPSRLVAPVAAVLIADHPTLDTPPPKLLT